MSGAAEKKRRVQLPEGVLAVRRGPGANCSSIGSVIDLLFGAAIVGGAIWAGILAALSDPQPPASDATKQPEEP